MDPYAKKRLYISAIAICLTLALIFGRNWCPIIEFANLKIYDIFARLQYCIKKPPPSIENIVIVGIGDETAGKMPYRWPYPRSVFAGVISNLTRAEARVIAFDFVFLGKSEEKDDLALGMALENNKKVMLANSFDTNGSIGIKSIPDLSGKALSGIVTKIQDMDGKIRRALTYLVNNKIPPKSFLSWEMAILNLSGDMAISSAGEDKGHLLLKDGKSKKWFLPVDPHDRSFIINFQAKTRDFCNIELYDIYKGSFDPVFVKDKIVLIGFTSPVLGDIHNTAIGYMPGITLNANALLTFLSHNFISKVPAPIEEILIFLGVILAMAAFFVSKIVDMPSIPFIVVGAEVVLFIAASYMLFMTGYIWDYFTFPFATMAIPFLSRMIYSWIWLRRRFYWT